MNIFKPKNNPFPKYEELVQVDFSNYKSPIDVYINEQWRAHKQKVEDIIEDNVFREVLAVGVDVDKKELIKALMYDRNQYGDGYAAGVRAAAPKWIDMTIDPPQKGEIGFTLAPKEGWVQLVEVIESTPYKLDVKVIYPEHGFPCLARYWMPLHLPKTPEEDA